MTRHNPRPGRVRLGVQGSLGAGGLHAVGLRAAPSSEVRPRCPQHVAGAPSSTVPACPPLLCRLKALLSQCPPRPQVFAAILSHFEPKDEGGATLTLPAITKLLSKLNKRGLWRHGLALFWALPSLGLKVRPVSMRCGRVALAMRACIHARPVNPALCVRLTSTPPQEHRRHSKERDGI